MRTDAQLHAAAESETIAAGMPAGATRRAAIAEIVARMRAEDMAAQARQDAQVEAAAERQRISAIVRAGLDRGRGRQALRAALLAPVSADAAAGLIAQMPPDATATEAALAVPAHADFGTKAAQTERRRIASAFAHPEAVQRFKATAAIILDSDVGITASQIVGLLMSLPTEEPPRDYAAEFSARMEAQAADANNWFGPGAGSPSKAESAAEGWRRAAREANRAIGVPDAAPVGPTLPGADRGVI